jgi:predicted ATPase/class 3 adenylate cyclase
VIDPGFRQRLTAILAADVAGYARLMAADAGATVTALDNTREIFRREIEANEGRVVDMAGDSVLAIFPAATGALHAALAVQKALEASSAAIAEERRMRVRIGVHLGDVIEKVDGTIYGHGVNVAARLQARAAPGGLCMSQTFYDSVRERLPAGAQFAGSQRFRNIEEPIAIWHIVPEGGAAPARYDVDATPNNLPLQLTSFIGRSGELAEAGRLLAQSRMLTLVGVGGIGKSRLSLELATKMLEDFSDGVWLVELGNLSDPRLVPQAVASVLGVKEAPGRPVSEALTRHFRDRRSLLILDNCEHLLEACADLSKQVLQSGLQAKVLASSREPLRVAGETAYAVPVLPASDAERLFLDRALAAKPNFRVNGSAAAVVSVCRRLDGIPLAIELAAARVRTLPVETIAARLDDRFRLLTTGDRTVLPRQQTLRALIDWSYDLLTDEERAVFRSLAVFAGGWTLEAAEAVCAFGAIDQANVLEHVTQLADKSLVVVEPEGERYRLLETVREYAHERLAESRERDEACNRHLGFYVAFCEKARPQLVGPEQGKWLARVDLERENILAAHAACSRAPRGAELGLQLVYFLRPYWLNRGLLGLGQRINADALTHPGAQARNLARCRALFVAGQLSFYMGRYGQAQQYLEESVAIGREMGDQRRVGAALQPLGMAHFGQGDLAAARRYLEEALVSAEALQEPREIAAAASTLAQLYRAEGSLDAAEPLCERVLDLAQELDDRESIAIGLLNVAMVAMGRQNDERARQMLLAVHGILEEIGSRYVGQSLLEVSAGLAVSRREWQRAARFYGAAEALALQTGLHRDPADEAFLAPLVAKAQAALVTPAFAAAESAGREVPNDTIIAEARAWLALPLQR